MLKINNIKGLQHVLLVNLLTEVYKCINNIGPLYLCNHFKVKELDVFYQRSILLDMELKTLCFMVVPVGISYLLILKVLTLSQH